MNALTVKPRALELGRIAAPMIFNQLVVIANDGSGSMTEETAALYTKANAADIATRELITRLQASTAANNFNVAVLSFDTTATVMLPPTHCPDVDVHADFDPLLNHGGGTDLGLALKESVRLTESFFAQAPGDGVPVDAVILLLSDGVENSGPKAKDIADQIKAAHGKRVIICAALLATIGQPDPVGERVLRSIVSDPIRGFSTVYNAETLRNFFQASVARASGAQLR